MNSKLGCLVLALVCALFSSCSGQAKIPVTVYYESLCPDSQVFLTQQLAPTVSGPVGKFVDLKLVPYGKSSYVTQGSETIFTCHHGPNECFGNKIQSCAIKMIEPDSFQQGTTKQSKTLQFINCLMKTPFSDNVYPTQVCGHSSEVKNLREIEQCANSTDGSNFLKENGRITEQLNPKLTSVPTIVFKDHYESDLQKMALANFHATLCKQIQPTPPECENVPGSATEKVLASVCILAALLASTLF